LRRESVGVGVKGAVGTNHDERHLTGVGFGAKEAAAKYGKEAKKKGL